MYINYAYNGKKEISPLSIKTEVSHEKFTFSQCETCKKDKWKKIFFRSFNFHSSLQLMCDVMKFLLSLKTFKDLQVLN
jgi:hypothetical protein